MNDYYGSDIINTKDGEHDKRKNFIGGEAPNVFISASKKLPPKNELQKFFKNKANKTRLQQFIKSQFKEQLITSEKKFFYSIRSECCEITKGGEVSVARKLLLERVRQRKNMAGCV